MLAQLVDNMKALGVLDEHGKQVSGEMIRQLQGMDGLLIYYVLFNHQLEYVELRELVEYLIDHDIIQRQLDRKGEDEKREWMRTKLRELRFENPHVTWDDVEARVGEGAPARAHEDRADPRGVRREGPAPRAARRQEAEEHLGAARGGGPRASSSSSRSTASSTRKAICSRTSCA